MRTFISLFFIFILIPVNFYGSDYQNYQFQFFFGRQPSAKSESMGRALVATNDGAFTAYYNPAGSYFTKGINAAFSHASPYYLATKANYMFYGLSWNIGKFGTIGINQFRFSLGENALWTTGFDPTIGSEYFTPSTSMTSLNYSWDMWKNLALGINLNMFSDKIAKKTLQSYPIDFGLMKQVFFKDKKNFSQQIRLGLSIKNILGSKVKYESPVVMGPAQEEALPIILNLGSSYNVHFQRTDKLPNLFIMGITLQVEYQDVLNYEYRSGFKIGTEISIFEILHWRMGYYTIGLNSNPVNGKKRLEDFTYGFGLFLPVNKLLKHDIPVTISIDMTKLKQPSYIVDFEDWEIFSVYSFNVGMTIK
jgi:hypothetical protein